MRRYPRLRDRSIFVGNPDDLVDVPLGPELPTVRDWALERYTCTGSTAPEDREALRAELGYRPGERVCLVGVGGSGVGAHAQGSSASIRRSSCSSRSGISDYFRASRSMISPPTPIVDALSWTTWTLVKLAWSI